MSDSDLNFFSTNEPNTSSDNSSTQDSFWKDSSFNTTQNNTYEQSTTYSYQSYGSTVPDPVKKEHPVLKKVAKLIACAACFGVVAGSCFFGTTKLYEYFFPNSPVVTQLSESTSKAPLLIASANGTSSVFLICSYVFSTEGVPIWLSVPVSPCPGKCLYVAMIWFSARPLE